VAFTGTGDVNNGGNEYSNDDKESHSGACALWDIVGKYEDGVEFTADCRLITGDDTFVVSDAYTNDADFFNRQLLWGNWFSDSDQDDCWAQYINDELIVDCRDWDYRGFKE